MTEWAKEQRWQRFDYETVVKQVQYALDYP